MEWSDLRIFLAVAREGTLGAAARMLGQSQPTMGRRLRELETSLGQTLFQRTADGFVLTDEGASVLAHAERMEEEADALERQLAGRDRHLDGLLRVSSSDWFGACVLTSVLAEFAKLQPRVVVELLTDARLYSLPRREADIAFRIRPFDEAEVISRRLMRIDYGVYARADSPYAPKPGDGRGTPLITMDTAFDGMPDAVWLKKMLPHAHVISRSNNRDVQARMCAEGAGVAVLPRPLADSIDGLRLVDLGAPPHGRDTFVGYHRDLKRLARLRALLALLIDRLAN
ncbi:MULTISPECIES: LysR family transcriptional regulator [unclassified Bradyrhizobium]|uniref:LysR family transcriptional regulator n=1 Tax=unclassified Bradyrhizobium TaxID=2631580 RepID=UPI0004189C84|nr:MULTISPECIES: LysR family transcriptional regulator [unclassified Bradyrhizobium]QIG91690.1 LysR family transcriptional regulator [Bradyrhizobium sp. 6(2017)]